MTTILTHIDWNDKMKNKMATERWNFLKRELDSVINIYMFVRKNKGNGLGRNICQKRLSKKIRYKQDMWRVYKHTGNDKDYDVYKEAL